MTDKRGGRREGSGRKKLEHPKVKRSVSFDPELLKWLDSCEGSRSALIERALVVARSSKLFDKKCK